ncbi:Heat shock cognate 71 kDa protein [Entomophthora muscae]|uniref:Heat shock cognate 71 kDa protein n=1 Tax=Entomophthora muscae TaxID=34485 RepID=A0ACC2RVE8_9FUNG|nr:Heat shock cognate 71 kDa protein [Entomophthora muscae]
MLQEIALRIDLGMAHISVLVIVDGIVIPVPGASGELRIPSFIGFTSKNFCVDFEALKQHKSNLRNTVFGAKRLVERDIMSLPDTSIACLPFRLISENQLTKVEVRYGAHIRHFFLEEILSISHLQGQRKGSSFSYKVSQTSCHWGPCPFQ